MNIARKGLISFEFYFFYPCRLSDYSLLSFTPETPGGGAASRTKMTPSQLFEGMVEGMGRVRGAASVPCLPHVTLALQAPPRVTSRYVERGVPYLLYACSPQRPSPHPLPPVTSR